MLPLLALALALSAAGVQDEEIRAGGRSRVHVIVSDASGRVDDLAPADFDLLERGQRRTVEDVRYVGGRGRSEGVPRVFAFFLDEFHSTSGAETARVRDAVQAFVAGLAPGDLALVFRPLDSLLAIRLSADHAASAALAGRFEGRKGLFEPRSALERRLVAADPGRAAQARAEMSAAALSSLVGHLGAMEGARKALVVVSEGFDVDARGARRGVAPPAVDRMARAAHRAGVSVHAIDPRPAGVAREAGDPHRFLRELAEASDGETMTGAAESAAGLARIAADLDGYYEVTFDSAAAADGAFHPLEVRVRRPGTTVRSPRGHWAPSGAELQSARLARQPLQDAAPAPPARRISPLIQAWFGVTRGDDGGARVDFVWEPAAAPPGRSRSGPVPAQVALRVSAADGTSLYDGRVAAASLGGPLARAVFVAPSGRLRVEMTIEDHEAQYLDWDARDVPIDDADGRLAMGTPRVFRARTARDVRLIAGDPDAVPVAAREFSRAERLVLRIPVHGLEGEPAVSVRLVNRFGSAMRTAEASRDPLLNGTWVAHLPLSGLVAGEYRADVVAAMAGRTITDTVAFRVTP